MRFSGILTGSDKNTSKFPFWVGRILMNLIVRLIIASILGANSRVSADDSSSSSVSAGGGYATKKFKVYLFDKGTMSF